MVVSLLQKKKKMVLKYALVTGQSTPTFECVFMHQKVEKVYGYRSTHFTFSVYRVFDISCTLSRKTPIAPLRRKLETWE